MAGVSEIVPVSAPQDQDVQAASDSQVMAAAIPLEDFRVRCTLKKAVVEVMKMCSHFVQELGAALPEDVRELVLRDAQWTFESAVHENVSINGQAWEEATDHCLMDSDIKVLEDEFDELIVDVATKRRQYPRRILESVIKTLKAQHASLKQYHPVVHPLDLKCDPDPDECEVSNSYCQTFFSFANSFVLYFGDLFATSVCTVVRLPAPRVEDLKCRGEAVAKEMSEAMKALPVLIEQGDGFSRVLKIQPVIKLQRINQEVFSSCSRKAASKPDKCVTHVESTPTETVARKASNIVLKRKQAPDCAQRKHYPLRLKRINLDM